MRQSQFKKTWTEQSVLLRNECFLLQIHVTKSILYQERYTYQHNILRLKCETRIENVTHMLTTIIFIR